MIKLLRYNDEFSSIYIELDISTDLDLLARELSCVDNSNNWAIGLFGSKKKAKWFIDGYKRAYTQERVFEAAQRNREVEKCDLSINFAVPLNNEGQNSNIVPHYKATPKKLLASKFRYLDRGYCLHKNIIDTISFNIFINLLENKVKIYILDEYCSQPYDYQNDIRNGRPSGYAKLVHKRVQDIMKDLIDKEIIMGYSLNDYI